MAVFPGDPANDQQNKANAHFQSTAPAWRDLYYKSDLYSLLYQERRNAVLSLVDGLGLPAARVLEVGCGPGITSVELAMRGHTVCAIDTVQAMIEMTRKHAADSHMERLILPVMGDINGLSFADNTFDLVIVVGVTEWMASLAQPMREIARAVKPGGYLIVTGDNTWTLNFVLDPLRNPIAAPLKRWVHEALRRLGRGPRAHCVLRSIAQLDASIVGAGLQMIRRTAMGFGPFTFLGWNLLSDSNGWRVHKRLQALADKDWPVLRSTGHIYLALAKKPGRN